MQINPETTDRIKASVASVPSWDRCGQRGATVLSGSRAAGLSDATSDIDVDLLLPEPWFTEIYEPFWEAVDSGAITVLNPRARLFDEYPIIDIPGIDGHYQIKCSDEIQARIEAMDDVTRWIYSNTHALIDDSGLHKSLQALARRYPKRVLVAKRGRYLFQAQEFFYGIRTQLGRDHWQSLSLLSIQSVSNVLKFCCLSADSPFPYEKWLYQVGTRTPLGQRLRALIDSILLEAGHQSVVKEAPQAFVRPGHRNQELEEYRLYHLFLQLFDEIDAFRRERFPEEVK